MEQRHIEQKLITIKVPVCSDCEQELIKELDKPWIQYECKCGEWGYDFNKKLHFPIGLEDTQQNKKYGNTDK